MFLTDDEKRMRDGAEGDAVAAAMDLLIRYGYALDAERLCDIRNVAGTMTQPSPVKARLVAEGGWDKAFAVINLDSDLDLTIPPMRVPTCQLQHGFGPDSVDIVPYPQRQRRPAGRRRGVLRAARGEHPRHLHAVPGGEPADARRALRVDGVVRGDLRQLGARRADQLRGDRVHRGGVADREDPVLGQPPGREPARHAPDLGRRRHGRSRSRTGGCSATSPGGVAGEDHPVITGRHRPARPDRAEALRRGGGDLRRRRAVPHPGDHAGGARRWRPAFGPASRCPSGRVRARRAAGGVRDAQRDRLVRRRGLRAARLPARVGRPDQAGRRAARRQAAVRRAPSCGSWRRAR